VSLGLGSDPPSPSWPVYESDEPDQPDAVMTVYNTAGRLLGRSQIEGRVSENYGVQIRFRAAGPEVAYPKASAVADALDSLYIFHVTLDGTEYVVRSVTRVGGILSIGKEAPTSHRVVMTLNALAYLYRA
jgi:hypothetical protein